MIIPDYEIRGVMFDVGRIPHRLQYLQDYTKILTWYKMNEFQLHLNDDFTYSPEGLPSGSEWNGMHRLESDASRVSRKTAPTQARGLNISTKCMATRSTQRTTIGTWKPMANAGGDRSDP